MTSSSKTKTIVGIIFVLVIAAGGWFVWKNISKPREASALDSFAQCLAQKKITMYGAYWCPHCQNEKRAFGSSWEYVPYVECTEETQKCIDQKIQRYPTWIFPDGKRFEGEMGVEKLSQESGCIINTNDGQDKKS